MVWIVGMRGIATLTNRKEGLNALKVWRRRGLEAAVNLPPKDTHLWLLGNEPKCCCDPMLVWLNIVVKKTEPIALGSLHRTLTGKGRSLAWFLHPTQVEGQFTLLAVLTEYLLGVVTAVVVNHQHFP
jgi:hypothetical protein